MLKIDQKIRIEKYVPNSKHVFVNNEMFPYVDIKFTCVCCSKLNIIRLIPFQSGFSFIGIYDKEKILSKNEIMRNGMANETVRWMTHFGDLTVDNLPTLYFGIMCQECQSKYILVFCCGESQPGIVKLEISGIWLYSNI